MDRARNLTLRKLAFQLLVFSASLNICDAQADELCFSCIGTNYIHPTEENEEINFKNQQASMCIDAASGRITHLSPGAEKVEEYLLTKHYPETFSTQSYYYWESKNAYHNVRFNEELKVHVEFSDIQYHLQVVHKNNHQTPRVAYNGRCNISKKLGLR